jgi:hypothetical protein
MAPRCGSRLCARRSPPDALPWRAARPGAAGSRRGLPAAARRGALARRGAPELSSWHDARGAASAGHGAARSGFLRGAVRGPTHALPPPQRSPAPAWLGAAARIVPDPALRVRAACSRPAWHGPCAARPQQGTASACAAVVPLRGAAPCLRLGPSARPARPARRVVPSRACDVPVYPLDAPSIPPCISCALSVLFILCS